MSMSLFSSYTLAGMKEHNFSKGVIPAITGTGVKRGFDLDQLKSGSLYKLPFKNKKVHHQPVLLLISG